MMSEKELAGRRAADYIEDQMIVGLGTGSTIDYFLQALAEKIEKENISITGVTTSFVTSKRAEELGIGLTSLDEVDWIDVTVDGADEVDPQFNGIKGGGGAHLIEKIVASYSKKNIWIVDSSKTVDHLGAFPLPVEVVIFGADRLRRLFESKGYQPNFRLDEQGNRYITDMGNYIIDLNLGKIENPEALAQELNNQVGVVEQGLFLNHPDIVIIGRDQETELLFKEG